MEKLHISFENFKDKMDTVKILVVDRLSQTDQTADRQSENGKSTYLRMKSKNYI